jgi:hypothetical protein
MYNNSNKKDKKKIVKKTKKGEISDSNMKKLKDVSKNFKGGMNSKHIKNMIKFMKEGNSFSMAHSKAVKLDAKK